jgi:hypothetical protein
LTQAVVLKVSCSGERLGAEVQEVQKVQEVQEAQEVQEVQEMDYIPR